MPKIPYITKRFGRDALDIISKANAIITEYSAQGYDLTLRQLYYQFVSRAYIANKQSEYDRLGSIINDARLAGYIDWESITDRTRNLRAMSHWDKPGSIIRDAAYSFHLDKWSTQPYRVEVWVEKEALAGVVATACNPLDVPYFSCRGYVSASEMWAAGQRIIGYLNAGQAPYIIHLGDHDPSGKDMSRDILDRLQLFIEYELGAVEWQFDRIALNMDQVDYYNPPPNPAKITDSRAKGYIAQYGDESWELDALEPAVLNDLITTSILNVRDIDAWAEISDTEKTHRQQLETTAKQWDALVQHLEVN